MPKHFADRIGVPAKWCLLLLAGTILSNGCARRPGPLFAEPTEAFVWPEPPEKPRIMYLGMLSTEADLHAEVSFAESVRRALFGRKAAGALVCPYAVAVDAQDRLFVADSAGGAVHIMDLESREYRQFSEVSPGRKFTTPVAVTVTDDLVFVADSGLAAVCVFDREGRFRFSFGEEVLTRPAGLAYDPGQEKVYVADVAQHGIFVFDREGRSILRIGHRGTGPGQFNFPTQLWVDRDGRLYVSDTLNYRVQVFSGEGEFLRAFGRQGDRPGYFAHATGVATDSFGNVYVSDRQFENVQIFDERGQILMAFGGEGHQPGNFWLPAGLWIDKHDRIFVADSFNRRVQVFQLLEPREL